MSSQAESVDLLVKKGKFEPQVALAITQAIDSAMTHSQVVTVPILDARLAELRAGMRIEVCRLEQKIDQNYANLENKIEHTRLGLERLIEATKSELVRWVFVSMLGSAAISVAGAFVTGFMRHTP
jgi:hypothetical protein